MLNQVSVIDAAATARMPIGAGACLPTGVVGTAQRRERVAMYPRPRAFRAVEAFGPGRKAAGLAAVAVGQPSSKKQYPHTTRIAASGGTKGPHPVRERRSA